MEKRRDPFFRFAAAVIRHVRSQWAHLHTVARRLRLGALLLRRGFLGLDRYQRPGLADIGTQQAAWTERQQSASRYHAMLIERQQRHASERPRHSSSELGLPSDEPAPPTGTRVVFLNFPDAECGSVQGHKLSRDYVLACQFLHCSIMDRTGTLDQGFAYRVLDPIPGGPGNPLDFETICDTIGGEIVDEALRTGKPISVFWSGGIDSTTALIAIIKAASARGYIDRICVQLSLDSISEYPGFFLNHISPSLRFQPVSSPMSAYLDPTVLNVTGEHGDQLFGSQLLKTYVQGGYAQMPYRDVLPAILLERLGSPFSARRVWRYLEPVIQAAPVPITSVFDSMWWLNYALKWQSVTLRLAVARGEETWSVYRSLRHFFRDSRFQEWALAHTPGHPTFKWSEYKEVAKHYILEFTGDRSYFLHKEKQDSLRNVMIDGETLEQHLIFMREDFQPVSTIQSTRSGDWTISSQRPQPTWRCAKAMHSRQVTGL